jgi:antibiotic biosynthesis monooxygenase (ABM) superfamily enzyme
VTINHQQSSYAVIFRSTRTEHSEQLYQHHSQQMEELVKQVPGFISSFSHRDPITQSGVTVAYNATKFSESFLSFIRPPLLTIDF